MFCKHVYTVLDKTTIPSVMDNACELGATSHHAGREELRRTYITVLHCPRCGKVRELINRTN